MTILPSIRTEYQRYRRLVELALAQVEDRDLASRPTADGNSIAILLAHLSGNLRSRFTDFLTSDGEKPWRRRDADSTRDRSCSSRAASPGIAGGRCRFRAAVRPPTPRIPPRRSRRTPGADRAYLAPQ